jgi:N-acetylmuramoyl-L-alanine amidase
VLSVIDVMLKLENPKRFSGNNRYDTNIAVLNEFANDLNLSSIYMATGENFPDALAGSALSSITSSPLLLINNSPKDSTKAYINSNFNLINKFNVVGGSGVISDDLVKDVLTNFGHTRDNFPRLW